MPASSLSDVPPNQLLAWTHVANVSSELHFSGLLTPDGLNRDTCFLTASCCHHGGCNRSSFGIFALYLGAALARLRFAALQSHFVPLAVTGRPSCPAGPSAVFLSGTPVCLCSKRYACIEILHRTLSTPLGLMEEVLHRTAKWLGANVSGMKLSTAWPLGSPYPYN